MGISAKEDLALFGNTNHIPRYLSHYDSQIKERDEINRELWDAPNYYAWILIASSLILYRVMEMFYYNDGDEGVFNSAYKTLLNRLFSQYTFEENEKEAIILFVKIRHLLVHKGFPNPHYKPSSDARDVANGEPFEYEDVWELAKKLRKPKIYPELKSNFEIAMEAISRNEKEVNHNFGCMQHTKVKNIKSNCLKNFKEDKENGLIMEKIIKTTLLSIAYCYLKLRDVSLPLPIPILLKRITLNMFLEFLTIGAILGMFVNLITKHPIWATLITALLGAICLELKKFLKTIIEHFNEITERQYNKHSLKDAYEKLKTMPLKKLFDPPLEITINELRKKL